MAKQTLVQLCHTLDLKKHRVNGWLYSEKLDGVRCWWDGGISRGLRTDSVPYANTVKDNRLIETQYATGLWSRSGKAKFAPDWFLDQLPSMPLDGELWLGRGKNQQLNSIVSSHNRPDWNDVQYVIFDSPPLDTILADRDVDIRMGSVLYKLKIRDCLNWITERKANLITFNPGLSYENAFGKLRDMLMDAGNVRLIRQARLPVKTDDVLPFLESKLNEIVDGGGEGLIVRNPHGLYETNRSYNVLKFKPFEDAEATVIGYIWGRETDFGSKLLGKMGALIVDYNGKRLELSGFTDTEREMRYVLHPDYTTLEEKQLALTEPISFAGKSTSKSWDNPTFPIGSEITFRYRELSNDGIPKEARFYRK